MPDRGEGEGRGVAGRPRSGSAGPAEGGLPETLHFHYSREERLKKLKTQKARPRTWKWRTPFANKRSRRLFLLLANLALVYAIVLTFVKPSNVYIRRSSGEYDFELNVTALRGGKTLIGVTVRNGKGSDLVFRDSVPVSLSIRSRSGTRITSQKHVDSGTVLIPGESTSVVFVFESAELPRAADLEIYFDGSSDPVFRRSVHF